MQWVDLPACPALSFAALERLYFAWVPRLSAGMVQPLWSEPSGLGTLRLAILPLRWPSAIRMDAPQRGPERWSRPIRGGLLAKGHGSLDFELLARPEGRRLVVSVRGLDPRLPRALYYPIQSQLHERSTLAYLREIVRRLEDPASLRSLKAEGAAPAESPGPRAGDGGPAAAPRARPPS